MQRFVDFFIDVSQSKELEMRREAAFNLPCFNLMFKQYSEELGIDF